MFLFTKYYIQLQSFDQGIIRGVKIFYSNANTERIWAPVDKDIEELNEVMKALDFVLECENIVAAWNYITDTLIQKMFPEGRLHYLGSTLPRT